MIKYFCTRGKIPPGWTSWKWACEKCGEQKSMGSKHSYLCDKCWEKIMEQMDRNNKQRKMRKYDKDGNKNKN